jgi:hypothetical protein
MTMTLGNRHPPPAAHTRVFVLVPLAIGLAGLMVTGCSAVRAVEKAKNTVENNRAVIGDFTRKVQSGAAQSFEAIYQTTGTSPATVVYAVKRPKGILFRDTPSGASNLSNTFDVVANSTGEYACSPPAKGATQWTCERLPPGSVAQENDLFGFYTPSHWVAFLNEFSIAAGFAGDKVSSSNKTVNGFAMHCVDLQAPGVPGTSTICTTSQGILGYVKVATVSTSFAIKTYVANPPAALFQLPPGAKITTATVSSTTG